MKQGQYPFRHQLLWRKALPQSPGTSLLRRVEASGPAEGYRSGAPLCGFIFAQRNCQLRGAACKVSCPLRCEPCQGSKPAGAPHPQPRGSHMPDADLCAFCVPLAPTLSCLLRRQISLLGEMLFPEPRHEPYKLGTVVG